MKVDQLYAVVTRTPDYTDAFLVTEWAEADAATFSYFSEFRHIYEIDLGALLELLIERGIAKER